MHMPHTHADWLSEPNSAPIEVTTETFLSLTDNLVYARRQVAGAMPTPAGIAVRVQMAAFAMHLQKMP